MKIFKYWLLILCLSLLLCALFSCSPSESADEPTTQGKSYYEYFDTVSAIFSYRGDSAEEFSEHCEAVSALLGDYHKLFDIYYEYAGINNLKTVNEHAGKAAVKVDQRLIDFLLYAKEIHTLTGGKTNVAMGSVLKLWHDARENGMDDPENASLPSAALLTEAATHTDIDKVIINQEEQTVFLADPQMRLDVGAIGKGYAAERAAELLIARGASSYVLNLGGNIRAIGAKTSGDGWITGITNPDKSATEEFACKVVIRDISLVTSGDYERYYTVNGVRYHHIIDPATLMPTEYFTSVSIICDSSADGDMLSTALFCMTYEQGLALIESLEGVEAMWLTIDGTQYYSSGFQAYQTE